MDTVRLALTVAVVVEIAGTVLEADVIGKTAHVIADVTENGGRQFDGIVAVYKIGDGVDAAVQYAVEHEYVASFAAGEGIVAGTADDAVITAQAFQNIVGTVAA